MSSRRLSCPRFIATLVVFAAVACAPSESTVEPQGPAQPSAASAKAASDKQASATPGTTTTQTAPAAASEPKAQPEAASQPTLSRDAMCDGICARAAELKCAKANDCPKMCAETMKNDVCATELAKATGCVLARPAADWQCTAQGVASIRDPHCVAEQKAFGDCLIASAPKR